MAKAEQQSSDGRVSAGNAASGTSVSGSSKGQEVSGTVTGFSGSNHQTAHIEADGYHYAVDSSSLKSESSKK